MRNPKFAYAIVSIFSAGLALGLIWHVVALEGKFIYLAAYDLQMGVVCIATLLLGLRGINAVHFKSISKSQLYYLGTAASILSVFTTVLIIRHPRTFGFWYGSLYSILGEYYVVLFGLAFAFLMSYVWFLSIPDNLSKYDRIVNSMALVAIQISGSLLLLRIIQKFFV